MPVKTAEDLNQPVRDSRSKIPSPAAGAGMRGFVLFCTNSTQQFLTNNSMQMAAAIAFYTLFSLFPLSLLIILGYDIFGQESEVRQEQFARVIGTFIPVSHDTLAQIINRVADTWNPGATGPLAFLGLVWASTAVFATVRKGVNAAWNVWVPRPFLRERVIDLTLTAGAGIMFMFLLFSTSFSRQFSQSEGAFGGPAWYSVLALALTFIGLSFLYWLLPNRSVRYRDVLFGALVAAIAVEIAKGIFFFYTQQRADLNQVYGSLTSVMLLMGWLYVSGALILIGALIAAIYSRLVQDGFLGHQDVWTLGMVPGVIYVWRRLWRRAPRRKARASANARAPEEAGLSASQIKR